jgi:hypothetical protein
MGKYLDILARAVDCDISDQSDKSPPPNSCAAQRDYKLADSFGRLSRFCRTFSALETRCPELVPVDRWQAAVEDGRRFLAQWGEQAEALGWTARDLFGLHTPPERPHPSYSRLSRYDEIGLIWLLRGTCRSPASGSRTRLHAFSSRATPSAGREVIALTEATAAIQNPTGAITIYRRHNKPALGPVGDSLDDLDPPFGGSAA